MTGAWIVVVSLVGAPWPSADVVSVEGALAIGIGDADGDGDGELVVSDPEADGGRGAVWVRRWGGRDFELAVTSRWTGAHAQAHWGAVLASLGDVDDDDGNDWLVASPDGDVSGARRGRVEIHFGAKDRASLSWSGEPGQGLGAAAAAAGDVDDDGHADVLVADAAGRLHLYRGGSPLDLDALVVDASPGELVGFGAAGDVDGDGRGEIWVRRADTLLVLRVEGADISATPTDPLALPAWLVTPRTLPGALALEAAGDLDGDGRPDVIVRFADQVALHRGTPAGLDETPAASLQGEWSMVRGAGDLDGDGFGDVLVGDGTRVLVLRGRGTGPSTAARVPSHGHHMNLPDAPMTIAPLGDRDGDGLDDFAVCNPQDGWTLGRLQGSCRTYGAAGPWPTDYQPPGAPEAMAGFVAGVGDVDGDGLTEMLVGGPSFDPVGAEDAGRVWLTSHPEWKGSGEAAGDRLGRSVAGIGDMNGDGFADFAAGAPYADPAYVVVWFGSPDGPVEAGRFVLDDTPGAAAGWIGQGGDFNGDGYADLPVGAPGRGRVYVLWGSATGPTPSPPDRYPDHLGVAGMTDPALFPATSLAALAPLPETNKARLAFGGSTCDEVILGALAPAPPEDGLVSCVPAMDQAEHPDDPTKVRAPQVHGREVTEDHACFGAAVASAGDVDGDGLADLLVGAPLDANGKSLPDAGRAFLYAGDEGCTAPGPAWSFAGDQGNARLGRSVASLGDIDGDGFDDVGVTVELDAALGGAYNAHGNSSFERDGDVGSAAYPARIAAWRPLEPSVPIPPGGLTARPGSFATELAGPDPRGAFIVRGFATCPFGPARARLEVEVKSWDKPFDGTITHTSDWLEPEAAREGVEVVVSGLAADAGYHWRARFVWDPRVAPPQPTGPWTRGAHPLVASNIELRTASDAPPILPDRSFVANGSDLIVTREVLLTNTPSGDPDDTDDDVKDPDDPLEALKLDWPVDPLHGELEWDGQRLHYRAHPGFVGVESLLWRATGPHGGQATAAFTIEVVPQGCGDVTGADCEAGVFMLELEMEDGSRRSIACRIVDGEPQCGGVGGGADEAPVTLGTSRCPAAP